MADHQKNRVLFYHSYFFKRSETFIYRQAINPHIVASLLSKRFYKSAELPTGSFTKFLFRTTLIDRFIQKWVDRSRYYGNRSIAKMYRMLKDQPLDLIHAQFGTSGVRILPVAKRLNVPMVVSFHGYDASRKLANPVYREGLKEVFDYASAIIVCNPGMGDALPLNEANKPKLRWVPYGIDIEQFSDNTPAVHTQTFKVLHVGRLVEKKGVPDLIRAFAKAAKEIDQATLHIVGDGRKEKECRALVKEHALESKVVFHGWKSPRAVKELMQQCDLFVLNSRVDSRGDTEGLPVGLLEAMAMGRPCISTRHAGIPLAIENDVSGVLVDERDTESLSQQIIRLYHNRALRHALGKAAREKVENQFTMARMHSNLRDIYDEVVNK